MILVFVIPFEAFDAAVFCTARGTPGALSWSHCPSLP